jgi:hypothetical protein
MQRVRSMDRDPWVLVAGRTAAQADKTNQQMPVVSNAQRKEASLS